VAKRKQTPTGRKMSKLGTQYDLAKVLGVSQRSVANKINGSEEVTVTDLGKLARHYKVPVLYFVTPDSITVEISRTAEKAIKDLPKIKRHILDWIS
jgi:transcriptional regulator with XRE-family HTH domain